MAHLNKTPNSHNTEKQPVDEKGYIINKTTFLNIVPKGGTITLRLHSPKEIASVKTSISRWNRQHGISKGMFITYTIDKVALEIILTDTGATSIVLERINPPKKPRGNQKPEPPGKAKRPPFFRAVVNGVEIIADDAPVDTKEVARYLHVTPNAVRCMCKKGQLPHAKSGRKNIYSLKIVQAVIFNSGFDNI